MIKTEPLISHRWSECSVCGIKYKDHAGLTSCCGAVSYLVSEPNMVKCTCCGWPTDRLTDNGLCDMCNSFGNRESID